MPLYQNVQDYIENKQMDDLKKLVNESDLQDLLSLIKDLPKEQRVMVFRLLNKDLAIEIFELLDISFQQDLLSSFKEQRAQEIFGELDPDDKARLMDELPAKVAKRLIQNLPKEEREDVSELLGYDRETAGRIMTPEYISIKKEMTASEALKRIKERGGEKETVYILYVTDNKRKLEGVVSLRELVMAEDEQKVEGIMSTDITHVVTDTHQERAARVLKEHDLLAVPVVDHEDRLVGIITIDDAMDILEEETTEEIFDKAGLSIFADTETSRSYKLIEGSIFERWKVRLPFLVITLIGGMLAGLVIEGFEESLEAIAALAVFIPVVMDTGGNVGTQSSTIFTRALVLGHINMKRFYKHWFKEIATGFTMGVILGTAAGIIAHLWQGINGLGLAIGVSMTLTMTIATSLGFLIPFILVKLNFDAAAGADPFITTIKDITGLFIYFTSVSIFLGHLL
ncbi:magnesium transporter [Natranaerofaba carboxydovora]|uniref:magnesium transporter n=1 Tax=Natranaerofaba carboxydovora TaxID=2742683 RepID=UPI001F13BA67|nr:magnesium transporter [Natranaerofaba carboxydovora]UMZ74953.1 Magnesium transporter MgtE [Natranaerofaba carboxydovora]